MKRLLPFFLLFLLSAITLNDLDLNLIGKWRGPSPISITDSGDVWQFSFEKKGCKITKVIYDWNEDSESWQGRTAEMVADGLDDRWHTENGFLTVEVRESYVKSRDLIVKYVIDGDTIRFYEAQIFRGKDNDLLGDWRFECYDQYVANEKRIRRITFTEDGHFVEELPSGPRTSRFEMGDGEWLEIMSGPDGDCEAKADTLRHPYLIADNSLYMWKSEVAMRMVKRPAKKEKKKRK